MAISNQMQSGLAKRPNGCARVLDGRRLVREVAPLGQPLSEEHPIEVLGARIEVSLEREDGHVTAEFPSDGGTRFRIRLPG